MKLANWDEYVARRAAETPQYAYTADEKRTFQERREALRPRFVHVVTVVGAHEEHDDCTYWLWMNAGPEDGPCHEDMSFKPACTTAQAFRVELKDEAGETYYGFDDDLEMPEHEHDGEWKAAYIRKTGYDYGFCDYGFVDPAKAELFRSWVATHTPNSYDMRL